MDPEALARALIDRALAYQARGQQQEAIDDYSAALRVDAMSTRTRAVVLYNRGLAYQKLKSQAMAIEDFTSALFLDPRFAEAFHGRGNALRMSGQYLFALADYEKARRLNHPAPYLLFFGEALTYQALQRPDDARKAMAQVLALKPDFEPAREQVGFLADQPSGEIAQKPVSNASVSKSPEPAFKPIVSGNHPIVTGAIVGPDLTVHKVEQPEPVPPAAALLQPARAVPTEAEKAPEVESADDAPAVSEIKATVPPITTPKNLCWLGCAALIAA